MLPTEVMVGSWPKLKSSALVAAVDVAGTGLLKLKVEFDPTFSGVGFPVPSGVVAKDVLKVDGDNRKSSLWFVDVAPNVELLSKILEVEELGVCEASS